MEAWNDGIVHWCGIKKAKRRRLMSVLCVNRGSAQPLGFQSRDLNLFKGMLSLSSHRFKSKLHHLTSRH